MRKYIALLLALSVCLVFTGCVKEDEKAEFMTSDKKILEYDKKDLPENRYYILKKNGKFQPLLKEGVSSEYAWFTSYDNLIPVYEKGDKLVYTSPEAKPYSFSFTQMKDIGYTTGIKYTIGYNDDESDNIFSFPTTEEGYCPTSRVGAIVGGRLDGKNTTIKDINGKKVTPLMFTEEGFLKGLTKDAMYQFGYYYGTKYETMDIKADTHVYVSKDSLISSQFQDTKKGYMIIKLPDGIQKNAYYNLDLEGGGMFKIRNY